MEVYLIIPHDKLENLEIYTVKWYVLLGVVWVF